MQDGKLYNSGIIQCRQGGNEPLPPKVWGYVIFAGARDKMLGLRVGDDID